MSTRDQLEIINAQGEIRFHPLQTGGGITNIGRHPDNDIVIDSPEVAQFHAILDHQQKPYRIIALNLDSRIKVGGELLQPNKPRDLRNWDTIELDGCSIILMEGGATSEPAAAPAIVPVALPARPAPAPGPAAAAPPLEAGPVSAAGAPTGLTELETLEQLLASIPEDRVDDVILVEPMAQNGAVDSGHPGSLDFSVEVEQPATLQLTLINGGDLVGEFNVEVLGIDPGWVTVSPRSLNLNEGERGNVGVAIQAPRLPGSRAKAYYFSVVVTSPNYPGHMSSTTGLFLIKPFYDFAVGEVDPKKQSISYTKRQGIAVIPIINQGNADASFQLIAEDDRHASNIEFDSPEEGIQLHRELQVKVPPETILPVTLYIIPRSRKLVGFGGQDISYTITVTPLEAGQTPRSVLGQARSLPLLGPIPIALFVLLLALLVVMIFRPWIGEFTADAASIEAGQNVTLSWRASPFAALRLEPGVGKLEDSQGSLALSPQESIVYTLKADNFLTLLPFVGERFFSPVAEVPITVVPLLPKVEFRADQHDILSGQPVTLSWEVDDADEVLLLINGAPNTIPPESYIGSRQLTPDKDTTYTLRVSNRYTPPEGISFTETVKVTVPTPTPLPPPVIERFDVTPLEITAGEPVTISWSVTGAKTVEIEGYGKVAASGSVTTNPAETISYVLRASNGQVDVPSKIQQVTVNPPPTATPLPGTPKIEFFTATPAEVGVGSPESRSIRLAWSVSGDTTNVEISGPDFGKASGLDKKGGLTVSANKSTLFILTAFNGSLSSSQTVQVKVTSPVPAISSISPASTTAQGPDFAITVNGTGFVNGSIVRWDGANRPTTFVSATQLRASISASIIATGGAHRITVFNPAPGGGTSGAANFAVNNPFPFIRDVAPPSATVGDLGFTMVVNGTGFTTASKVRWDNADLPTSFLSSTQLTASFSADELDTAGQFAITVFNPAPGGGTSGVQAYTISAGRPVPSITSITPNSATAGVPPDVVDVELIVDGSGFSGLSQVQWDGLPLNTTLVGNQLHATIPAAKFAAAGNISITVYNPPPGGGTSALNPPATTFTVNSPSPSITSLAPSPVAAGGPGFILAISGDGFISASRVRWNGVDCETLLPACTVIPTSRVQILVSVPSAYIETVGSATLTVENGSPCISACVSGPMPLDIYNPTPVVTALSPSSALAGTLTSLTITGTNFVSGAVVTWTGRADLTPLTVTNTQITVNVPASYMTNNGTLPAVGVTNPVPCMASDCTSSELIFTVYNRTPSISSLSPGSIAAGSAAFTLTINGTNFVNGTRVFWSDSDCTLLTPACTGLTVVSGTQITVTIPAAYVAGDGSATVHVVNPAECHNGTVFVSCASAKSTFTINQSTPVITALSPGSIMEDGPSFTLTITGQNFGNGAVVTWSGQADLTPATITSTQITALIPGSYINNEGSVQVRVVNPGPCGGTCTSNAQTFTINDPTSTTTITFDGPDPSTAGQAITVNISVTGGAAPTGSVTVGDGTVSCSITLSGPGTTLSGSCTLTPTTAGAKTLIAVYSGNPNVNPSSDTEAHQVNRASSTTTITSDTPDPSIVSQPITVSVSVTSAVAPDGTVTVSDGSASCSITLSGPGTTLSGSCTLTPTTAGAKTLTASYAGNANVNPSSDTEAHQVNRVSSTTTITSDTPDPSTAGQAVSVSVSVTSVLAPTGTVTVSDGPASCTITLTGAGTTLTGSCSLTPTLAGARTLTASYAGNANVDVSSDTEAHLVNQASSTTTITSDGPDPSTAGQAFTVNVSVTSAVAPTGTVTVTVSDGSGATCSFGLAGAGTTLTGSCTLTLNTVGAKTLTATYAGNVNVTGSSDTESHQVNQASSTTNAADSPDPSTLGNAITMNVSVTSAVAPTGTVTVTVSDGSGVTCSITLSGAATTLSGSCALTPTTAGFKTLTVTYSGNANVSGSSDTRFNTVNP